MSHQLDICRMVHFVWNNQPEKCLAAVVSYVPPEKDLAATGNRGVSLNVFRPNQAQTHPVTAYHLMPPGYEYTWHWPDECKKVKDHLAGREAHEDAKADVQGGVGLE